MNSSYRSNRFVPSMQALEDRSVPAVISFSSGVLSITGTAAADVVRITQDDAWNRLTVQDGVQTRVFASSLVSRINVNLAGGNDQLRYGLASDYIRPKQLVSDLGAGADLATLDFGINKSHVIRNNLTISVLGGTEGDTLRADFGEIRTNLNPAPVVSLSADMGTGNDFAALRMWGWLDGAARANFTMLGSDGADSLSLHDDYGIAAGSWLNVVMDGGAGNDSLLMYLDGPIAGTCSSRLNGGMGDDVVDARLTARAGAGFLDVATYGHDGNDRMRLEIINLTSGALHLQRALMDGGTGVDSVLGATANVTIVNFP
jgi:hypothetical protein